MPRCCKPWLRSASTMSFSISEREQAPRHATPLMPEQWRSCVGFLARAEPPLAARARWPTCPHRPSSSGGGDGRARPAGAGHVGPPRVRAAGPDRVSRRRLWFWRQQSERRYAAAPPGCAEAAERSRGVGVLEAIWLPGQQRKGVAGPGLHPLHSRVRPLGHSQAHLLPLGLHPRSVLGQHLPCPLAGGRLLAVWRAAEGHPCGLARLGQAGVGQDLQRQVCRDPICSPLAALGDDGTAGCVVPAAGSAGHLAGAVAGGGGGHVAVFGGAHAGRPAGGRSGYARTRCASLEKCGSAGRCSGCR
mmetsp:Transcript_149610/g.480204  ORF Transcript_149610/g.480204 Transcript_149610/m.480204 type:complete len:303 (+) Transcript_149610:2189-3097(+)